MATVYWFAKASRWRPGLRASDWLGKPSAAAAASGTGFAAAAAVLLLLHQPENGLDVRQSAVFSLPFLLQQLLFTMVMMAATTPPERTMDT